MTGPKVHYTVIPGTAKKGPLWDRTLFLDTFPESLYEKQVY